MSQSDEQNTPPAPNAPSPPPDATMDTTEFGDILDILVSGSDLSADQADQARRRAQRSGVPLHQAVTDLGFASEEAVYRAVARFSSLEFVVLGLTKISDQAIAKIPAKVAFHYRCVPIAFDRATLRAAFSVPPPIRDRENLRLLLGLRVEPVISSPVDIRRCLKEKYGLGADTVLQIRQDRGLLKRAEEISYDDVSGQQLAEDEESASIIRLVNQILLEALELNTTDIHLEPFPQNSRLRYRIDGMLRDVPTPPGMRQLHESIVSRMKVMANLNIAEKRLPHDGRIRVRIGTEKFDLRVSILPTRFGETLCLRILNRSAIFVEMDQLGMNRLQLVLLNKLVQLPHGIVLVTGPTGSGKTTTLYAALAKVRNTNPERKIITVEDPVEYELEGTSQIQMRSSIGLTFASALRSILRHDPDIVLVGEIRDGETAEIAIRASLTGHLVLSTLHTNDSVGAVNRLIDMGIEPFLVAASLVASLAQRLVRRICPHCKGEDMDVSRRIRGEMAQSLGIPPEDVQAWIGSGCLECNQTGYRGRLAVLEIFLLDEDIQELVSRHATSGELREAAFHRGMRTLRDSGWEKVTDGLTTIEEITRITSNLQLSYHVEEEELLDPKGS